MATPHHQQRSICLEELKQPKFLDCHHTFCLECLRGLENKTPGFINCPLCQREIQLPSGGVDKLTTNFYIQVGVEDGETGPREVGQLQRGIDSQQVGRDQTANELRVVSERKTIKVEFRLVSNGEPRTLTNSLFNSEVHTFELDIYMTVSNIKYIDFNLK